MPGVGYGADVFINCPFDADYKPLFAALVFTIQASGYRTRCALEENNSSDIRYDKLCRLVRESQKSVHDLSRITLNDQQLPRFNMPFELGLFCGAHQYGSKAQRTKTSLILTERAYALPRYLSDLSGNDVAHHEGDPHQLITRVRRYLHTRPDGTQLPGAGRMIATFDAFKAALPELAAATQRTLDELDPFDDYKDYVYLLTRYLERSP